MPKPKVFSLFQTDRFEDRFPDVNIIGRSVDLFVECLSYNIEIPLNSAAERELDIFEEAILRMIELKKCPVGELSDILCLEKDLVSFIVIRLTENGLLQDETTISERGREILDLQAKQKKEVRYEQGKLFVLRQTGLILPYVHTGEFQSEQVEDADASTISIGFGSAGNSRTIKGRRAKCLDYETRTSSTLGAKTVKDTIKTFNGICSFRGLDCINLSMEYGVISSLSENIYFHMKAAVQEGNIDSLIISDGFVPNIDGMLDYLLTAHTKLIGEIKSRAVIMSSDNEAVQRTEKVHTGYREIYRYYENAAEHITDIDYDSASKDQRDFINESGRQVLTDCYHAVEWCLYYHLMGNPVPESILKLFRQRSAVLNCNTVLGLCSKIGLRDAQNYKRLFMHLDRNKIDLMFRNSSPTLYTCLPLAVAEAANNSDSRFHKAVCANNDLLGFMNMLNSCGELRHSTESEMLVSDPGRILRKTEAFIASLLPDFEVRSDKGKSDAGNISQARLLAQLSLEKLLGSVFFYSLSSGQKNEWIRISPDKKGAALPDLREYIEILYRIMQSQLSAANMQSVPGRIMSREEALDKSAESFGGKLPKSFTTVLESNYIAAAGGAGSTLGAHALLYYAHAGENMPQQLNALDYIGVIDSIVTLRGHGDMLVLNETTNSLNGLRDKTAQLTKLIGGYHG